MYFRAGILTIGFIAAGLPLMSQNLSDAVPQNTERQSPLSGFIRSGFFGDLKKNETKPFISSGFVDFGLKTDYNAGTGFRGFADIRFRYGSEFAEPVSTFNIREAFAEISIGNLSLATGKKIIKWGRADFTNPTSKLNPQNFISRSPDREDMDLGNILAEVNWYPSGRINFQGVIIPFYGPSVLIVDPVPLPAYVSINQLPPLITDRELVSYGLKTDIHLKGIDMGISWFEGYDPMPGIAMEEFSADFSGTVPLISAVLQMKPYKTRNAGIDFESSIGSMGIRGEAAWSDPVLSFSGNEYVPFPEIKWVAGIDFGAGNWRYIFEYSGKTVLDHFPSAVEPIIGSDQDMSELAGLMMTPGFDLNEYFRQQVGAFNRLYNYQLEKNYHSAGLRIESDLFYGKASPSLFTLYNFTSHDLLIIPEIRIRPADGIALTLGAEIYNGKKNSLYDIVDDFMTSIYIGLRADF